MKLSLLVQVYNGGTYWQECWQSVLDCQDLFDQIFVSISRSPSMEKDIALIQDCRLEKLHWVCQNENLSARDHGKRLDQFVGSFQPEGHIFILCHDDILLRDGLLKLKQQDIKEEDAVFGPHHFFYQEGSRREITTHEFHRDDSSPLDRDLFFCLQDQQEFTYNISGLVLPAKLYTEKVMPWHILRYGALSECCHLTHPEIKRIHQSTAPTVKIRWRSDSEGSIMKTDDLLYDSLVYHLLAVATAQKAEFRMIQCRSVMYMLRVNSLKGIFYFILLQFKLAKLKYYYPAGWKIYGCMLRIIGRKITDLSVKFFAGGRS